MWVANTDPSSYDALKFQRVILNDNDVYDQNTGEFKTPVDGTYMFTANVCVYPNKYLSLKFLADDTVMVPSAPATMLGLPVHRPQL